MSIQEVHKLKRDHPQFAPRLEAAAAHQVLSMRMSAMRLVEFPAWYQPPEVQAALTDDALKVVVAADAAHAVDKGELRGTAVLRCKCSVVDSESDAGQAVGASSSCGWLGSASAGWSRTVGLGFRGSGWRTTHGSFAPQRRRGGGSSLFSFYRFDAKEGVGIVQCVNLKFRRSS